MGGGLATYEDSGKVFLRSGISGYRGRNYPALQELDTPPFLPRIIFGNNARYRNVFNDWIQRRLRWDWFRFASTKDRPLGR